MRNPWFSARRRVEPYARLNFAEMEVWPWELWPLAVQLRVRLAVKLPDWSSWYL